MARTDAAFVRMAGATMSEKAAKGLSCGSIRGF
jgi:hypothetical protein